MAYASVASLLETIDLVNYHRDSSLSPRFKDQITSLEKHTSLLQSFLEDDPKRGNNWEETIREVTDRAEEIIDLLVSDSLLENSSNSQLHDGLDELEKVTEEIESTAERVKGRSTKPKEGHDEELMGIIARLREGSPEQQTIAIVGLEGTGKSSLAGNAYNHPSTVEHFNIRASATISREYSRRGIITDLLRSVNEPEMEIVWISDDDELFDIVNRSLQGKRYLIVLYDVWSIDAWDMLRPAFPYNENGSRIILTTSDVHVARKASDHVHEMRLLDKDGTWDLLREKIFKGDPCPSGLESMGKMIAGSCDGNLLSVEVVSCILSDDQSEAAWEDISKSIGSLTDYDDVRKQILYLSYKHLPHHLRPCFLYLASFPEGRQIHVSKLVKLWVAEGFLNESGSKSFQEIGEEHAEHLVRTSLVSVGKRKSNGRIKSITIHESIQDWCKTHACKERFSFHNEAMVFEWFRRVSNSNHSSRDFLEGVYDSTIRTISLCLSYGEVGVVRWSIGNVRLLRILDLSNAYGYDLPEEVFELFHLRFLAFYSEFSVSEAISNLQNLQTLIICPREDAGGLENLPEGIWRMPQLRHLGSFYFKLPTQKEGETFALENLETLSTVVDFVCSRESLEMIPNVKKLALFYPRRLRKLKPKIIPKIRTPFVVYKNKSRDVVEDYVLDNLIHLHKLETLKIEVSEWRFVKEQQEMSYAFPSTLKKLNLCGLQLSRVGMRFVASLPNLQVLKLRRPGFPSDAWETSEGGFSSLEYLLIEESNLKLWMTGSGHFPKLKTIVLRSCLHLSKVPNEIGKIPTLQLIELDNKNQSLSRSAKHIQEDRQSLEGDRLQILVV